MRQILKFIYHFFYRLFFRVGYETRYNLTPITFKLFFFQKILGFNRKANWPVHFTSRIGIPQNIKVGISSAPGFMPGCYIQGIGGVEIGDYCIVAPNVGIISSNHDIYNFKVNIKGPVKIGDYCWLGMNSVVLPDVTLGDFTIVASGSVVTKSFPMGHCVIAGTPAKIIRTLDKEKCIRHNDRFEYYGYTKKSKI